jgi:hypothetical protein
MDLPEDDPSAFGKVVDGIYKQFLDCSEHQPTWAFSSRSLSIRPIETAHQVLWCKVWIMADKLGMTDLACQTILQYRRCLENSTITIGPMVINFVYENTLEGSDLRELLFHRAMQQFSDSSKEPDLKGLGDVTAGNNTFNGEMLLRVGGHIKVSRNGCKLRNCSLHDDVYGEWAKQNGVAVGWGRGAW